jgi:hypothetical protein
METKTKIFGYVAMEINRLTKDEDLQQELWVLFLEKKLPRSIKEYLSSAIKKEEMLLKEMESLYGLKKRF